MLSWGGRVFCVLEYSTVTLFLISLARMSMWVSCVSAREREREKANRLECVYVRDSVSSACCCRCFPLACPYFIFFSCLYVFFHIFILGLHASYSTLNHSLYGFINAIKKAFFFSWHGSKHGNMSLCLKTTKNDDPACFNTHIELQFFFLHCHLSHSLHCYFLILPPSSVLQIAWGVASSSTPTPPPPLDTHLPTSPSPLRVNKDDVTHSWL